jgi:hypothetical protein
MSLTVGGTTIEGVGTSPEVVTTMIDAGVKIIDRLIQLLEKRQARREHYFTAFVDPVFHDAEEVAKDYIGLFGQVIAKLGSKDEDISGLIKWLEERRLDRLPVRIKLRALVNHARFREWSVSEASRDKFQRGVLALMQGGLSLTEEGHLFLPEYGYMGHTILDLLYHWAQKPLSLNRNRYLADTRRQLEAVERAWKDVVEGYAEIKADYMKLSEGRY